MDVSDHQEERVVIALAGALGTELDRVSLEIQVALRAYQFDVEEISLSAALRDLPGNGDLPEAPYDVRVWEHMEAGNAIRRSWGRGDALALMAIRRIAARRDPGKRTAHVLRSVKHPDEVATLRAVYGPRFFLVSAYRPRETRLAAVRRLIEDSSPLVDPGDWAYGPERLLERDEFEAGDHGQQLRETFHLADFFVDAFDRERMRPQLERFAALIFGDPFRTPTREEYALACAEMASLRSAELGRQVGACLASPDGEVIALGTNEVPRPGGGVYWEGDLDDAREFHIGTDTNDDRKRGIAVEIVQLLSEKRMLGAGPDEPPDPAEVLDTILLSQLGALTEFGRAAHAEMSALLDAARRGVSVRGARLYSTTFPCHNCARHLILAGVTEVVYVAPYAKSQAFRLHDDAVAVARATPPEGKLHLRPFVGVAPRLYPRVFAAGKRKDRTGKVVRFEQPSARLLPAADVSNQLWPMLPEAGPSTREQQAIQVVEGLLGDTLTTDDPVEGVA